MLILCSLAITVGFNQTTYIINENDGALQLVLILSNPSSTDITIHVNITDGLATGEYSYLIASY